jgi:hypothetical protein
VSRVRRALGPTTLALVAVGLLGACSGRGEPDAPAPAPSLAGARVMLLPARAQAPEQLDSELAFWLVDATPETEWVLPAELQAAVDRAPAWRLRLDALPRAVVDVGGGDRRVRDPLYGALRKLGAVVDADLAVIPLSAAELSDSTGVQLALAAALVDIRGGRVLWLETVRGERNPERGAAVASVAETLARLLVP